MLLNGLWSSQTASLDFDNRDQIVNFADGTRITNFEAFQNLQLGAGNDKVVFTGLFNDSATLGSGNDTIDIGQGLDIDGGAGTDVLKYDWSTVINNAGVYYEAHTPSSGSGDMRTYNGGTGHLTSQAIYSNFEQFDLTGTSFGDDLRRRPERHPAWHGRREYSDRRRWQ